MQTSAEVSYLDSSALVKLVATEPESDALNKFLAARLVRVSCALARVEVIRAARHRGLVPVVRARELLQTIELIELGDELLDRAADLQPIGLRSLDAIHLAAAQTLGAALRELVTYDRRMIEAARTLAIRVVAPGAEIL